MLRHVALIALFAILTGIGLVGGWFAAKQSGGGAKTTEEPGAEPPAEEPKGLDAKTLANLGVRVEPAKLGDFTHYRKVQAVVEDRPRNTQPVVAPLGGIVTQVHVAVGDVADANAPVVAIARDPIPRPKPELTADILTPISEDVHTAVSKLRSAMGRARIVDRNLARIRKSRGASGGAGVPVLRRSEIDFENERARLDVEVEDARHELERHGLTTAEIAAVEAGEPAPPNRHLWEHALRRSGLWPAAADAVRNQVPSAQRDLPWCIVAVGELAAAGLATNELAAAMKAEPELRAHFAECAGLLLQGMPLATLELLASQGALAPTIVVRAPSSTKRWDVADVAVRPGQRVDAGARLVRLHDPSTMWLRLEPVGAEIGMVSRALEQGAQMVAIPLVEGAGPTLEEVTLGRIATGTTAGHHAGHAYAEVPNELIAASRAPEARSRSWKLRAGTRYLVRVPLDTVEQAFVIPADAVTSRGADRIVFLEDGTSFRPQVVRILYEDDAVAVISNKSGIFDGDRIAVSGAFALGLALQLEAGSSAVDPHAGHSHN